MQTITAHFKLVTPMFMGSADTGKAELRLSSINGVLRFWFRALAWDRLKGNMSKIKQLESHVFGGIDNKDSKHHSFLMRFESQDCVPIEVKTHISSINQPAGLFYLGGPGCINSKYKATRQFFKPDNSESNFTIKIVFRHNVDKLPACEHSKAKATDLLIDALKAMSLIGGLGSRSRRGFGSVKLTELKCDQKTWIYPETLNGLETELDKILNTETVQNRIPEFSAISKQTKKIILKNKFSSWDEAHNWIGQKMIRYRSYGQRKNGQHQLWDGTSAEQRFRNDHDLVAGYIQGKKMNSVPDRCIFGLPHNYSFSSVKDGLRPTVMIAGNNRYSQRRASPLFVRIFKLGKEDYRVGLFIIKSTFLPSQADGKRTEISAREITNTKKNFHYKKRKPSYIEQIPNNWQTLNDFLDYCQQ